MFDGRTYGELRTLREAKLTKPFSLGVDSMGRVYVCDYERAVNAVVVLDGTHGTLLATIPVTGRPRGVAITRGGAIVISTEKPRGVVVVETL